MAQGQVTGLQDQLDDVRERRRNEPDSFKRWKLWFEVRRLEKALAQQQQASGALNDAEETEAFARASRRDQLLRSEAARRRRQEGAFSATEALSLAGGGATGGVTSGVGLLTGGV